MDEGRRSTLLAVLVAIAMPFVMASAPAVVPGVERWPVLTFAAVSLTAAIVSIRLPKRPRQVPAVERRNPLLFLGLTLAVSGTYDWLSHQAEPFISPTEFAWSVAAVVAPVFTWLLWREVMKMRAEQTTRE